MVVWAALRIACCGDQEADEMVGRKRRDGERVKGNASDEGEK